MDGEIGCTGHIGVKTEMHFVVCLGIWGLNLNVWIGWQGLDMPVILFQCVHLCFAQPDEKTDETVSAGQGHGDNPHCQILNWFSWKSDTWSVFYFQWWCTGMCIYSFVYICMYSQTCVCIYIIYIIYNISLGTYSLNLSLTHTHTYTDCLSLSLTHIATYTLVTWHTLLLSPIHKLTLFIWISHTHQNLPLTITHRQ